LDYGASERLSSTVSIRPLPQ